MWLLQTPWLHPTPEYLCVSFSDWPTFTHTWVITCYQIKTHCPFLYFEETSLSTWLYAISTDLACSNIFNLICSSYLTVCLFYCCNNIKLWTAMTADILLSLVDCVGGLLKNLLPQRGQPKSKKWHRDYLDCQEKNKPLRKTHFSGVHNRVLQEITDYTACSKVSNDLHPSWQDTFTR